MLPHGNAPPCERSSRGLRLGRSLTVAVERVTGRADRPDEVGPVARIERLAQAADVDVDRARVNVGVVRPDRVEQPLARKDAPGMLEEMLEQPELGRAERHLLPRA